MKMEMNLIKANDKEKNAKSRWRKKDILHLVKKLIINTGNVVSGGGMRERRQKRNIFKVLKEKTNCQLRKPIRTTLKNKDKINIFFRRRLK